MELPLAARELTRSGKLKRTYIVRLVALGTTCPVLFFFWIGAMMMAMSPFQQSSSLGERMGGFLAAVSTYFQFAVVFLVAPVLCAGQIAREKENRTLELLVLADFRSWDIFFAKFLAPFLQSELLILSTMPLLAFASFLGGVSVPAMALQVVLMTLFAFAVCALGLLSSTVAKRQVEALFYTVAGTIGWLVCTRLLDGVRLGTAGASSTLSIVLAALRTDEPNLPGLYWLPSAVVTLALAVLCCALSIALLPRIIFERPRRVARWRKRGLRQRWGFLRMGPAAQLVAASARGLSGSLRFLPVQLLAAVTLAVLPLCSCGMLFIIVLVLFFYDTTSTMAMARESGALDDVRVTPLEDWLLARAVLRAFFSKTWIYLPAIGLAAPSMFLTTPLFSSLVLTSGTQPLAAMHIVDLALSATILVSAFVLHTGAVFFFLLAMACFVSTFPGTPARQTLLGVVLALPIAFAIAVSTFFLLAMSTAYAERMVDWLNTLLPSTYLFCAATYIAAFFRSIPYACLGYVLYRAFVNRCRGTLSANV